MSKFNLFLGILLLSVLFHRSGAVLSIVLIHFIHSLYSRFKYSIIRSFTHKFIHSRIRHEFPGHQLAANGDVVVVAINYRLGALGFMSMGDYHAPGNYSIIIN